MTDFSDDMTLGEARALLRTLVGKGHHCPTCTQFAKVYKRRVHATMAATLIKLYRASKTEFVHVPSLPGDTHEASQLAWWGLAKEELALREDGGRAGWWRITPEGVCWVERRGAINKYAHVYDGRCLGHSGERVSIGDALGKRFDYNELMRSVGLPAQP